MKSHQLTSGFICIGIHSAGCARPGVLAALPQKGQRARPGRGRVQQTERSNRASGRGPATPARSAQDPTASSLRQAVDGSRGGQSAPSRDGQSLGSGQHPSSEAVPLCPAVERLLTLPSNEQNNQYVQSHDSSAT